MGDAAISGRQEIGNEIWVRYKDGTTYRGVLESIDFDYKENRRLLMVRNYADELFIISYSVQSEDHLF